MRIGYITYEYPPDSSNGGIATYVAQSARMMARRGHDVEVFASSDTRFGRFETDGIVEHWIKESDRELFGIVAGHVFATRHAENPFDVLEGPEFNADARKAVELIPDVPLVVKMHTPTLMSVSLNTPTGFAPSCNNIIQQLRGVAAFVVRGKPLLPFSLQLPSIRGAQKAERIESTHARKADIVAPPSQDLREYAMREWHIPEESIRLAPHPFIPSKEFLQLQPKSNGVTVGFVGRLEIRKGVLTLAAAIPHVLNVVSTAKFRFIGVPGYHPSGITYEEWIRRRIPEYAERLEFVGKVPLNQMPQAYDSLDICVFPSVWENFPNVCLEAMSAARAVIASSAGGMSEMLDHGRAGRLVAPNNPILLAREIVSLLKAPSERIRLGELARKRVLDVYNENVIGEMMARIYREAIARKRKQIKFCLACDESRI